MQESLGNIGPTSSSHSADMEDFGATNVDRKTGMGKRGALPQVKLPDLTIANLRTKMEAEYAGRPEGTTANIRTALGHMIRELKLTETTPLDPIFTSDFERSIDRVQKTFRHKTVSARRDFAQLVKTLREIALRLFSSRGLPAKFHDALIQAMSNAGYDGYHLAKAAKVPIGTMYHWVRGTGNPSLLGKYYKLNAKRLSRLERVLGIPAGTLSSRIVAADRRQVVMAQRTRIQRTRAQSLRYAAGRVKFRFFGDLLPPKLVAVWERYLKYKTAVDAGYAVDGEPVRRRRKWRTRRATLPGRSVAVVVPSADKEHMLIGTVMAFACLPSDLAAAATFARQGMEARHLWRLQENISDREYEEMSPLFLGLGRDPESLTIMDLVNPAVLAAFIGWRILRSGGESGWIRTVLGIPIAMLDPDYGFVTQSVDLAWDYAGWARVDPVADPDGYELQREKWAKHCKRLHARMSDLKRQWGSSGRKSRDPHVELAPILQLQDPIRPLIEMIDNHAASRPLGRSSKDYAVWLRDTILLRLFASMPLRNRNVRDMEWYGNNSGNLYRDRGGMWRIRFASSDFKNESGAASEPYDVPVAASLHPFITEYIGGVRQQFGNCDDPAVFLCRAQNGKPPRRFCATGLSMRIYMLSSRFLPKAVGVIGFRTHAYRHIAATAYLKGHPGDYVSLAHILHDRLETVLKNYAYTRAADGVKSFHAFVGA
jgi:hypothetical protein